MSQGIQHGSGSRRIFVDSGRQIIEKRESMWK